MLLLYHAAIVLPEEERDGPIDFGYKFALHVLNRDKVLLPNTTIEDKRLYIKAGNSFRASKQICSILEQGVVAILGAGSSQDPALEWELFWTSATMDTPLFLPSPSYLKTTSKISQRNPAMSLVAPVPTYSQSSTTPEFAIRLAPSLQIWGDVLKELVTWLHWESGAILYEDEKGLMKMQSLLREPVGIPGSVFVKRVTPDTYRHVLEQVKQRNIRQLMVDCPLSSLPALLKAVCG